MALDKIVQHMQIGLDSKVLFEKAVQKRKVELYLIVIKELKEDISTEYRRILFFIETQLPLRQRRSEH